MKTAGQIDCQVSFTAGQFAWCLALTEPPDFGGVFKGKKTIPLALVGYQMALAKSALCVWLAI